MKKILYIKASPKEDSDSITFRISEAFIDEYKKINPDDDITTLDLYKEDIDFLSANDLEEMHSMKDSKVKKYAQEFKDYDKYIIAAPFWNLSFPSVLKAYIDYIMYAGITFKYTENGPVGLLEDKKAIYFVARGGSYSTIEQSNYEYGEKYIRAILTFMGIGDIKTIACELTNILQGKKLEDNISRTIGKALDIVKDF